MKSKARKKTLHIPVAKPWIGAQEARAAERAIMSGWVTQGSEVAAFEREFAATVGAVHACATSNCTTALHIALLASGIKKRDEVITASHSFIATANSIRYCGAKPVFIDIDPVTFNISPDLIEQAITEKTRAILAVHQMGMPCDMKMIMAIARDHDLKVIEDAACAAGSRIRRGRTWEMIGRPYGDAACFSFHPRKLLTTGDGGMVTTRHDAWDAHFRLFRQHGMSVPDAVRHAANKVIFESYPILGYNYRMTDIQAAIGREQLKRLDVIIQKRRQLAEDYRKGLEDFPDILCPQEPEYARSNWQSYCVRLPQNCNQKKVMQDLLDQGISTRRGIMCAHREKPYTGSCQFKLPESEKAQDQCIILPLYHTMSADELGFVADRLKKACTR